ncbi:MAG: VLRF1 family aeRF1-type release factor [Bacillota bacterium]|nr:VLRF1 family aeRF1-type release factor [Bacillota bacterium]
MTSLQPEDVRKLLQHMERDTLSLYLDTDPTKPENQRRPEAFRIWARHELKKLPESMARVLTPKEQKNLEAQSEMLLKELELLKPQGRTFVFFSSPQWQLSAFYQARLHQNSLHFGAPHVAPLLWLMEEYARAAIVLLDHQQARFMTVHMGITEGIQEEFLYLDTADYPEYSLRATPIPSGEGAVYKKGSFGDVFARRVEEQVHRFWRDAAQRLEKFIQEEDPVLVLLAGEDKARSFVRGRLSPAARERVLEEGVSFAVGAPEREILLKAKPLLQEGERQREVRLVESLLQEVAAKGKADAGAGAVLNQLREGNVRLVAAAWPITREAIYVCQHCGAYFEESHEVCPLCGGEMTRRSFATALAREVHLKSAQLELVTGKAAERLQQPPYGRVAAQLRF